MNELDSDQLRKWLADDYGFLDRWRQRIGATVSNKVPRRLRLLPVLSWIVRTTVASSAPALAAYYNIISWNSAAIATVVLLVGNLLAEFLKELSATKKRSSIEEAMITRVGDLLNSVEHKKDDADGSIETALSACLGIIETCARSITRSDADEIAVALLLYSNDSKSDIMPA